PHFPISPPWFSVARDGRVDLFRPAVYAAREVVDFREALAREEGADLRAAHPVVAHEDRLPLAVERGRPLVEEAEREEARALDARQLVLLRLAHVNQERLVAAPQALGELGGCDRPKAHRCQTPKSSSAARGKQTETGRRPTRRSSTKSSTTSARRSRTSATSPPASRASRSRR